MPLDQVSLCTIQKNVEKMKKHYEYCSSLSSGRKRAMCFYGFKEIILSAETNFLWPLKRSDSKAGRGRYGCLFLAYGSMSLLLALISKENMKYVVNINIQKKWERQFENRVNRIYSYMKYFEPTIVAWRTDQITPVKICEINVIFWKEHEMNCEIRWRRDVIENGEDISSPKAKKSNQITSNAKEQDIILKDDDPDLNIADKIGGYGSRFDKVYRASVTDPLKKNVMYSHLVRVHINESRSDVLATLYKEGFKIREKYKLKVKKEVKDFNIKTVSALRNAFDTFGKAYREL